MKKYLFLFIFLLFYPLIIPSILKSEETEDLEKLFEKEIHSTTTNQQKKENIDFTGKPSQLQFPIANRSIFLDIMAAIDTVLEWDNNTPHNTKNQYYVRTGEFGFYSAIDQLAYGTLTFAAHNEGGELFPEVHEAFFLFPSTLIPRTNIRLGKMFPDVGRLNGIHQHDWHFTTPPIVHEKLLDYEGILDTGIEFRYLFPWSFWQELSIGIFNGRIFGHAHDEGENKQNPLLTTHLKHFFALNDFWGTEFGFSYLRWHPDTSPHKINHQYGLDFYLKYKKGKLKSFIWQTEMWYRETKERPKDRWKYFFDDNNNFKLNFSDYNFNFDPPKKIEILETHAGLYHFLEYQILEQWFIGYRYDYYLIPTKQKTNPYTLQKEFQKNGLEENSIILTYKPSEFSYFRLQASTSIDFETGLRTWQYYFQAVFIIGMHPAHKY